MRVPMRARAIARIKRQRLHLILLFQSLSMSIIYKQGSTTRSLDIVCKDRLEFDIWTIGLQVRQLAFFIQIAFFLKEVFHGNNRTCCSVMDFKNKIVHAWTEKVVRMRYAESRKHYGRKVIDRRKSCRTINICRKVSVKYFCR